MKQSKVTIDYYLLFFLLAISFTSNHTFFMQFIPQYIFYPILGIYLIALYLNVVRINIFSHNVNKNLFIFLVFLFLIGEFKNLVVFKAINWFVILGVIYLIWLSNKNTIENFLKLYLKIILIIFLVSTMVSVGFYLNINIYEYVKFLFFDDPYLKIDNVGTFPLYHVDTWLTSWNKSQNYTTLIYPRIPGHLHQGSLMSAYIFFPLGLSLLFTDLKNRYIILLILILLSSLSGSIYAIFITSILLFIFYKIIKKINFFIIPIFFIFIFFLSLFIASLGDADMTNWSIYYDDDSLILKYILRISSGMHRLATLGEQIYEFLRNPLIGPIHQNYSEFNLYLLGSFIITSGIRSGILGFVIAFLILYRVTNNLINYGVKNQRQKFGVCVIYSCILQMFIYQDFGYSSTIGLIFFSILLFFLEYKKKGNILSKRDANEKVF